MKVIEGMDNAHLFAIANDIFYLCNNNSTLTTMKKYLCFIFALIASCSSFTSCEKDGTSDNSLVGSWLCVKEVNTMSDGTVYTYTDKNEWSENGGDALFPYLLTFSSDGVISGKTFLEVDAIPTTYSVKSGYIYNLGIQWAKIVSNNGNTLVLELSDTSLELNNIAVEALYPGDQLYAKSVATYSKQ